MNRIISTFFLCAFASFIFAQSQAPKTTLDWKKSIKVEKKIAKTGFEKIAADDVSVPTAERSMFDVIVGTSFYDLQTNNSIAPRLTLRSDGTLANTWTMSQQTTAFSDRGAGYNTTDASHVWGPEPTVRIQSERTGFNNYCIGTNGREHIICHTAGAEIMHLTKMPSETDWVENKIPSNTPQGGWWARAAVSGDNIHVVYITMPTGNGGQLVDGLDGLLIYNRSTDGGQTWDKIDVRLPGIDSLHYSGVSAEEYAIEAQGNTVAIGIFTLLGDKMLLKSDDNGETWTSRVVQDFPIEAYDLGPYEFADIAHQYDTTTYPDSLAMFTSDGAGALIIDATGKVHVTFASLWIMDTDFSDRSYNYFPGYNTGIVYWNEDMADDAWEFTEAYSPDLNGDDEWGQSGYDNFADYGWAFCTQPSMGLDDNGNLYVCYLAPNELDVNDNNASYFRKPFYTRLEGSTWCLPQSVLNDANHDSGLSPFQELTFPQIARTITADSAFVIAQMDYTAGSNVFDGLTDLNTIQYYSFPVESCILDVPTIEAVQSFELSPNPASDYTLIRLDLDATLDAQIRILDQSGRILRTQNRSFQSGQQNMRLDLSALPLGLYYVQMLSSEGVATKKLVIK